MDEIVIKKEDVDRLAKELLKEIFDFFNYEYIINNFEEMKIEKPKFLNNLVFNHIIYSNKKGEKNELHKPFLESFFNKKEFEYTSKLVDEAMKDDGIDTERIYLTLNNLYLEEGIEDDLTFKKDSFLDIFRVFYNGYSYLLKKPTDSKVSYLLIDPTNTPLSQIIKD